MIEERSLEAVEALEIVKLIEGQPTKVTTIGANLDPMTKGRIVEFLKKNLDVFALSDEEIPSISEDVI